MDPDAAAAAMDSNHNGQQYANGDPHTMMDAAAPSTANASSSSAAAAALPSAAAADRSDSDGSASELEFTMYRWDDKHHRPRNTVQHKAAQLQRETRPAAAAAAAASSESLDDELPADAPDLVFTSSSEWGTDEDENLRKSYFMHTELVPPPTPDGKGKSSVRQKKIYVCLICSLRYKRTDRFLKHVQSHEISAASMLEELQQQSAQQTAQSIQEAEGGEEEPRFFVETVQVVVQYSCKLCQPQITLYEKLSELNRHILVEHLSKTAPALLTSRPQHRSSLRVPVLRSLGGSNSDDENGDEEDGDSPPVAHARTKHTPSRFSKGGAAAAASSSNGRKRKSIASTSAGPDEDGCALSHGVTCVDCSMVFPSENDSYRKHRQGHLRFKSESSLAQQHMTDEQRAAHEAAHPEQQAAAAAAAGGRAGALPGSKPLTRAQLAAISKRSDDEEEKADKDDDSDTSHRMRRNPASASSLVTQQMSPPELRVSCDGCQRIFSRRSALNRHIRSNKCKGVAETNGRNCNSEDDSSGGDEGSDGDEYHESSRRADPNLYYCKFCSHVAKSRTSYYTHRKKCANNPEVNGAAAAAAVPASSHGMDQLLAATGEQMHDGEPARPFSKPPLHRQRSAEKSANGPKLGRPAMRRSQTEPMGGAADSSHSPKGADRFAAKDLICPICKETFTHPFSVNRHMSVHPDENSKGPIYTCKHCNARFGHSQRFHKHESTCASRLQGGTGNSHAAAAAAPSNDLDEPPRAKRPRKSAASSTDTSVRLQSGDSSAAAPSTSSLSDPMMDAESSAVGDADHIDSRSSSLESHAALQAPKFHSAESPFATAAVQQPINLQLPMNQPLSAPPMQLSSFAPPPALSTALTQAPTPTLSVAPSASTVQPFSFAPLRPTSQIGSCAPRGSQLSGGFGSLPPFPQMPQPQPMQTPQPASSNSHIDSSDFSFCIQGVGLRAPVAPSAAASLGAPASSSAPSPASIEVAMAAASTPPPRTGSDRSLTSGSFSPATTAFNLSKLQAASAPGKRAASIKKKVGYEATPATSASATAAPKPGPAASAASASTVPASASASVVSVLSSNSSPAAAPATAAAAGACPMCSTSLSSFSISDQREHRRKCMDKLVRLSISQRSEEQKRPIEEERQWIRSLKPSKTGSAAGAAAAATTTAQPKPKVTQSTSSGGPSSAPLRAAGSEAPASASTPAHQTQLPLSWSVTPPKLTATLQASARPSLAAPTPASPKAAAAAASSSATAGVRQPTPPSLSKLATPFCQPVQLSPRVQTGHGGASWPWAVKKKQ